ncbi:MAG: HK97 gp10 family phage protein [Planctomycetaceae bacterium]
MSKGFEITGHKKIDKLFKQLTDKVQKNVVKKAMRIGMKPLLDEVKQNVPVDTGATKNDIRIRAGKRSRDRIEVQVSSKNDNYIPKFLEFGTSKMAARPFYRPAYESKGEQAKQTTMDELLKIIEVELSKGGK